MLNIRKGGLKQNKYKDDYSSIPVFSPALHKMLYKFLFCKDDKVPLFFEIDTIEERTAAFQFGKFDYWKRFLRNKICRS